MRCTHLDGLKIANPQETSSRKGSFEPPNQSRSATCKTRRGQSLGPSSRSSRVEKQLSGQPEKGTLQNTHTQTHSTTAATSLPTDFNNSKLHSAARNAEDQTSTQSRASQRGPYKEGPKDSTTRNTQESEAHQLILVQSMANGQLVTHTSRHHTKSPPLPSLQDLVPHLRNRTVARRPSM